MPGSLGFQYQRRREVLVDLHHDPRRILCICRTVSHPNGQNIRFHEHAVEASPFLDRHRWPHPLQRADDVVLVYLVLLFGCTG